MAHLSTVSIDRAKQKCELLAETLPLSVYLHQLPLSRRINPEKYHNGLGGATEERLYISSFLLTMQQMRIHRDSGRKKLNVEAK